MQWTWCKYIIHFIFNSLLIYSQLASSLAMMSNHSMLLEKLKKSSNCSQGSTNTFPGSLWARVFLIFLIIESRRNPKIHLRKEWLIHSIKRLFLWTMKYWSMIKKARLNRLAVKVKEDNNLKSKSLKNQNRPKTASIFSKWHQKRTQAKPNQLWNSS